MLGIDVTFNLGWFYLTLCSYQNFKMVNEQNKHPVMIGPALIHSVKDHATFSILFQEITNRKPSLGTALRAYGTDGEQALSSAAADAFPFAIHLLCANHLKDNNTVHLHKELLPESVVKEMPSDILGSSNEKGLIHSFNSNFDEKLKILQKRWGALEKGYKVTPVVFRWFKLHIAPIICENVCTELLQDLGLEGEKYTQNNSESVNALVKRYVDFQKQDVLKFINNLEECVQEQQNEIGKAVLGLGRWMLSPCYSHVRKNTSDWFGSMSLVYKQHALSSLQATVLPDTTARENSSFTEQCKIQQFNCPCHTQV